MRAIRLLKVGLGVTVACVVAGAVAGVLCLSIVGLIVDGPRALADGGMEILPYAALIGGMCGLLVGPIAVFGFLRRVPLGRLFLETIVGAALGGLLGFALNVNSEALIFGLPVGGFAVAVAHLAWRYRATHAQAERALAE